MMEANKEWKVWKDWRFYMALAVAATMVLRVLIAADPPFAAVYAYLLALPYAAFVYPVAEQARQKRIPGLPLLAIGFLLVLALSATKRYTEPQTAALMVYLLMLLFAGCVCYPMAYVLPEARAKKALAGLIWLFIGLFALLSLLGVAAACTGNAIPSLAGADYPGIGSVNGRLYAYFYPSAFALATGLALLLTPRLFGDVQKKPLRILLVALAALLYLGMALTGATTVQLVFAVCVGGFAFLVAGARLSGRKKIARALLSLAVAAAAVGVCFGGQWAVKRAADAIMPAPAPVSASAGVALARASLTVEPRAAQGAERRLFMPRAAENETAQPAELGFVALRVTLWRAAFRLFADRPALLLTGTTPVQMAEWLSPYLPEGVSGANMRFLPMQALVAFGAPGLLLTLAFVLFVLFHCARLFFCGRGTCSIAERSLALVPLFCLLLDCTDCYLTLLDTGGMSALWFFLAAGYVVSLSTTRIPKKKSA